MGAIRFEEKERGVEVQKEARGKVSARKGKRCKRVRSETRVRESSAQKGTGKR